MSSMTDKPQCKRHDSQCKQEAKAHESARAHAHNEKKESTKERRQRREEDEEDMLVVEREGESPEYKKLQGVFISCFSILMLTPFLWLITCGLTCRVKHKAHL